MKRKSTSQETYYVDIIDLIIDFVVGRANMVTIFVLPPKATALQPSACVTDREIYMKNSDAGFECRTFNRISEI